MKHEVIERMVRQANPVPDPAIFESPDVDSLLVLDERRQDMSTTEMEPRKAPETNRGWGVKLGVAVAFVACIVVVGLVATNSSDTASGDPLTDAEQLVNAWGASDLSALDQIPDDAAVSNEDWHNVERATLEDEMLYRQAVDWPFEVVECSPFSAPASFEGETISCAVTHDPSWTRAQGLGPYPAEVFVRYVDGTVAGFRVSLDVSYADEFFFPIRTWVTLEHQDDVDKIYPVSRNFTLIDEQARELWATFTEEYIDQLDG